MKANSQTIAAETFEWFSRYLLEADIFLLEEEEYDDVKACFIEYNTKPIIDHPGRIITSQDAYSKKLDELYRDDSQKVAAKPPKEESGCGLTAGFLEALFILQHVKYSDTVINQTSRVYKAIRTYYPESNRDMLKKIEAQQKNPYATALISWAKRKQPIHVRDRVHLVLKLTPGHPGSLNFHIIGGGVLGSNEPYDEDRSKYVELDVFGDDPIPEINHVQNNEKMPSLDIDFKGVFEGLKNKANKVGNAIRNPKGWKD